MEQQRSPLMEKVTLKRIAQIRRASRVETDDWKTRMEEWMDLTWITIHLNVRFYESDFGRIAILPSPYFKLGRPRK